MHMLSLRPARAGMKLLSDPLIGMGLRGASVKETDPSSVWSKAEHGHLKVSHNSELEDTFSLGIGHSSEGSGETALMCRLFWTFVVRKCDDTFLFGAAHINKQVAQRATIAHLRPMCQGQISFKKNKTKKKQQKTYKWAVGNQRLEIELIQAFMPVLVTSNFDDDSIKNEWAWRHHFPIVWEMFSTSKAANSVVSGPIWPRFELVRDFMHVLVTYMYKYKKDRIKNNREKVETSFFPL